VKKLLAVVAVLAPALTLLPAAPASADNVCLPITIDGQPVCQDTAPLDAIVAQVQSTIAQAIVLAEGTVDSETAQAVRLATVCPRIESNANSVVVYVATGSDQTSDETVCTGYKITVESQTGQPVHIPQICLTTTGTCVGPVDETIPGLAAGESPLTVCVQAVYWWRANSTTQWSEADISPNLVQPSPGCVSGPALP